MITPLEILYIIITTLVVGYVFSGIIRFEKSQHKDAIFNYYKIFSWQQVKWGIIMAAPGIILHELAHKFTALSFGLIAEYQIWPTGLLMGIILRALNTGFIVLAPGYVVIQGATSMQSALTAFAGPLMNLILWLGSYAILKYNKKLKPKTQLLLLLTQKINMWLFIFNMIPIPPLDGSKIIQPILNHLF